MGRSCYLQSGSHIGWVDLLMPFKTHAGSPGDFRFGGCARLPFKLVG